MPIKPIDFQIMVPRAMDAAKVSSDEAHRNHALLQQQTSATQHKAEDTLKTVYSRSKAQDARITEKQRDEQQDKRKKKDGRGREEAGDKGGNKPVKDIKTCTIDIKI
ncbi:MAG TPA: hypothetical protein VHT96_01875 [Clostridia bacterium]|nr:hypothetical protein [Clostridia bacterium]